MFPVCAYTGVFRSLYRSTSIIGDGRRQPLVFRENFKHSNHLADCRRSRARHHNDIVINETVSSASRECEPMSEFGFLKESFTATSLAVERCVTDGAEMCACFVKVFAVSTLCGS